MNIETLKTRKENAEKSIMKKQNTVNKKQMLIGKKEKIFEKLTDEHDIYWTQCEISELKDDIIRLNNEIDELNAKITDYDIQIEKESEKETTFASIPDIMKELQTALEEEWNNYDMEHRNMLKTTYKELGYKEFMKKYGYADYEFKSKTNEQIKSQNTKDAKMFVFDLYRRVKDITGEVTDWSNIHLEYANIGCALNGYVIGKKGTAEVRSIKAGGYNIQRLHIRVLVKKV